MLASRLALTSPGPGKSGSGAKPTSIPPARLPRRGRGQDEHDAAAGAAQARGTSGRQLPARPWKTTTMISSIRLDGTTACMTIDGPTDTEVFRPTCARSSVHHCGRATWSSWTTSPHKNPRDPRTDQGRKAQTPTPICSRPSLTRCMPLHPKMPPVGFTHCGYSFI